VVSITRKEKKKWRKFKEKVRQNNGYVCAICGEKKDKKELDAHHLNYENLGNETFEDVICCCKECHAKLHGGFKIKEQTFNTPVNMRNTGTGKVYKDVIKIVRRVNEEDG
jgi:5-methylcytosine-specific restriction endonuclease McrA